MKGHRRKKTWHRGTACLWTLGLLAVGCASPLPPTGGPPDKTPPVIAKTEPVAGAVLVTAEKVRIEFSEYIEEASFVRAFSITPEFDQPPKIHWKGKRVDLSFHEAFRANTTYVLTLDNNLRDLHGVALRKPLTLAFSTGSEINKGRLSGRVLAPGHGNGLPGMDVYAYAVEDSLPPDSLPARPDYRTQTDENGHFLFEYMSEEPFFVIALRDRNRNRMPDPNEAYAVPPRPAFRPAIAVSNDDSLRWIATTRDTIPPVLRQVQPRSNRRFALRFSEPVHLARTDTSGWILRDSTTARRQPIGAVYSPTLMPQQVMVLTDSLPPVVHSIYFAAIEDSSGNPAVPSTRSFAPSPAPDTLRLRFIGFLPDTLTAAPDGVFPLRLGARSGVRFNEPIPDEQFSDVVSVTDTLGRALPYSRRTTDGVSYQFQIDSPMPGVVKVDVNGNQLGQADTVYTRRYHPLTKDETGELSGIVDPVVPGLRVELFAEDGPIEIQSITPDSTGHFVFRDLPGGGRYRFRAFIDRNKNGRWDGGFIVPYRPAEPLGWSGELPPVRARWESVAEDTLRVR